MNRLSFALLALGALAVAASAGWWWLTYSDVIHYNYISTSEASTCLIGDSEICRLARTLCRGAHPVALIAYRAAAFWLAMAALSASLVTFEGKTASAAEDQRN
jgi:hypothetical protein